MNKKNLKHSAQFQTDLKRSPDIPPPQQMAGNTGVISVGHTAFCSHIFSMNGILHTYELAGKTIALQAWTGPEGSRMLRLQDFKTIGT